MPSLRSVFAHPVRFLSMLSLLLSPLPSMAKVLFVANNGTDAAFACGEWANPCRSISQAIENAVSGDQIEVGPGLYGDIDSDGSLGFEPGEEPLNDSTLVLVNKPVSIYSQAGADTTIIRAPRVADVRTVVALAADGITFGRVNGGFTIVGTGPTFRSTGIVTDRRDVRIVGNVIVDHGAEGITLDLSGGGRVIASGNTLTRNEEGFIVLSQNIASFAVVDGNIITGNKFSGILVFGQSPHVFTNNRLSRNLVGFAANGGPFTFRRNIVVDNLEHGFVSNGTPGFEPLSRGSRYSENTVTGNALGGFRFSDGTMNNVVQRNNIFGNGVAVGASNCGIFNASKFPVNATQNYWGARTGPGADPADATQGVCLSGAGSTTATTPFSLQLIPFN